MCTLALMQSSLWRWEVCGCSGLENARIHRTQFPSRALVTHVTISGPSGRILCLSPTLFSVKGLLQDLQAVVFACLVSCWRRGWPKDSVKTGSHGPPLSLQRKLGYWQWWIPAPHAHSQTYEPTCQAGTSTKDDMFPLDWQLPSPRNSVTVWPQLCLVQ